MNENDPQHGLVVSAPQGRPSPDKRSTHSLLADHQCLTHPHGDRVSLSGVAASEARVEEPMAGVVARASALHHPRGIA